MSRLMELILRDSNLMEFKIIKIITIFLLNLKVGLILGLLVLIWIIVGMVRLRSFGHLSDNSWIV